MFEFYTASIGLAGLVGALCVVGAFVGFSHLPVHWWALGLLFLSMFGFAIDVQAGGLGPWTFIGTVSLVAGSLVPLRRRLAAPTRRGGCSSWSSWGRCCSCSAA